MIHLTYFDLGLAALLVLVLAGLAGRVQRGLRNQLLVAALRTTVQLLLVGLVLKALFAHAALGWVLLMALFMLAVAGREVRVRQTRRLRGLWGYGVGTLSLLLSSFSVTLFALLAIIGERPWYEPQYAIPLLGMVLGNSMTGTAIALERLHEGAWQRRAEIEARLMLGHPATEAVAPVRREALRAALIPVINAMAAAGVVSLPGMMTGQILAGAPPVEAVKYQILIMFLIAVASGIGALAALALATRRLFDARERLRLDRLEMRP
ncbi:ABC transporter permease [Thiohalobacter sp.]|uniref:ABC transporter permease n=1 Tax=Thiohalobacter sp. TaxID=2025948 RepID=UPI002631E25F|nr:iron export ABC transporter permease subunit FetB [Thiohalobacter sp.]